MVGAAGHDVGGVAGHGLAVGSLVEVVAAVEEVLGAGAVERRGAAAVDVDPLVAFEVGAAQPAGVGRCDAHQLAAAGGVQDPDVPAGRGAGGGRVARGEVPDAGEVAGEGPVLDLVTNAVQAARPGVQQLYCRVLPERHRQVHVQGAAGVDSGDEPAVRVGAELAEAEKRSQRGAHRRRGLAVPEDLDPGVVQDLLRRDAGRRGHAGDS